MKLFKKKKKKKKKKKMKILNSLVCLMAHQPSYVI